MVSDDEMRGTFHAVRTAEGHVVEYDGDEDETDFWLAEFKKADTVVQVDVPRADRGRGKQHGPDLRQPGRVAPASTVAQPTD